MTADKAKKLSSYQKLKSKLKLAEAQVEKNKKIAEEYLEKLQWAQAELENARKISERELENYRKYSTEKLILKILPVIDDFERIMTVNIDPKLLEGIKLVYQELYKVLEAEGLKPIKAVGEKFDPFKHEAVDQVVDNNCEENTVLEELQKGYTLNLKVIRASKVKVSKKG